MISAQKLSIASVILISEIILLQPALVSAITESDDKCIKRAYQIGYNLTEPIETRMNALSQLEGDCIYSGLMSQEAKCLVWIYDNGIRITQLSLTSPNSTDNYNDFLADYYTEADLINHECTSLDFLYKIGK